MENPKRAEAAARLREFASLMERGEINAIVCSVDTADNVHTFIAGGKMQIFGLVGMIQENIFVKGRQ